MFARSLSGLKMAKVRVRVAEWVEAGKGRAERQMNFILRKQTAVLLFYTASFGSFFCERAIAEPISAYALEFINLLWIFHLERARPTTWIRQSDRLDRPSSTLSRRRGLSLFGGFVPNNYNRAIRTYTFSRSPITHLLWCASRRRLRRAPKLKPGIIRRRNGSLGDWRRHTHRHRAKNIDELLAKFNRVWRFFSGWFQYWRQRWRRRRGKSSANDHF